MPSVSKKLYLGDGVYVDASDDSYYIVLTTENGISVTNRIVMEPPVLDAFIEYLKARGVLKKEIITNA